MPLLHDARRAPMHLLDELRIGRRVHRPREARVRREGIRFLRPSGGLLRRALI
jgi:hypothetical protein